MRGRACQRAPCNVALYGHRRSRTGPGRPREQGIAAGGVACEGFYWLAVLVTFALDTAGTSAVFPAAILATVIYLTITRADVIDTPDTEQPAPADQAGAEARIADLEKAWDDAEDRLRPMDGTAWAYLDEKIDEALKAVRAATPDPTAEKQALDALLTALR